MHGMIKARQRAAPARLVCHNVVGETLSTVTLDRRRRKLSSVVRRANQSRPFIVSLHKPGETLRPQDHTVVLRAAWKSTTVESGDVVLVTYLPAGGAMGGGNQSTGKQIGMAVAVLALAVAAP